ncbi:MAG: cytochrome c biogenesis protein ResB [Planctomycetes bacterium]|nr:cytochrome c biogenesis protein ResB [Planctomycetota bacterium]
MRVKPLKPGPLWRFFASVWLAVGLMLVIGVVCIVGHGLGIKETEEVFFGSWWFSGLLIVLGVNITVCTLSRSLTRPPGWFPWQLSQLPWLMTHLGLLVIILAGLLTSLRTEGQLFVLEGTAERRMFLQDREVVIERPGGEAKAYDIRLTHLPATIEGESLLARRDHIAWIGAWVWGGFVVLGTLAALLIAGREPALLVFVVSAGLGLIMHTGTQRAAGFDWDLGDGARLQFDKYYPHHEKRGIIEEDPSGEGPPGVEVDFDLTTPVKRQTTRWLPVEPGYSNVVDMHGEVVVAAQRFYGREDLARALAGEESLGSIVVRAGDQEAAVSLDALVPEPDEAARAGAALGRWVEVGGYRVHLARFFWKLIVVNEGGKQVPTDDAPGKLQNPAVQVDKIEHPGGRVETFERLYAFGNPDYRGLTIHAAPTAVDVSYRLPVWHVPPGKNVVCFVVGPRATDVALLRTGPDRPAPATVDEVLALPRLDGPVEVEGVDGLTLRFKRHAWSIHQTQRVVPIDTKTTRDGEKFPDAVFVRLKKGEHEAAEWLPFGLDGRNRVQLRVGDETWTLNYRAKQYSLPFDVFLKKFKIEWAPGLENQRPLAFESEVTVKNEPSASVPSFDYRIYMNHTLVHQGFTFYQSSYIRQPGQPDISIFQVQSDPGQYVFYLGSLVMSLGVLAIFYLKPWLRQVELRRRGQAPLPRAEAGGAAPPPTDGVPPPVADAVPPPIDAPPIDAPPIEAPPIEAPPAEAPATEAPPAEGPPRATGADDQATVS